MKKLIVIDKYMEIAGILKMITNKELHLEQIGFDLNKKPAGNVFQAETDVTVIRTDAEKFSVFKVISDFLTWKNDLKYNSPGISEIISELFLSIFKRKTKTPEIIKFE